MGGKGSGAMVAKGLDKVAAGETLPPNIIKAIVPMFKKKKKKVSQAIFYNPTNDPNQTVDETSTISINKINTTIN